MKIVKSTLLILLSFLICNSASAAPDENFKKQMDSYLADDKNVATIGNALQRYFQKKQQEEQKKMAQAEQQQMEDQFKNPTKIDIGSSPVRGNPNAKVTIVEFSDFQCPFCQRGSAVMEQVLKAYPNDVKIVFKNMPLSFHQFAEGAAKAALAAGKQGKFWEMHDALFKNQQELDEESLVKRATELGLNVDKFKTDMNSEEIAKQVKEDMELGQNSGVNGTPGFFVNGVLISGAQPFDNFKKVIDRWLKK